MHNWANPQYPPVLVESYRRRITRTSDTDRGSDVRKHLWRAPRPAALIAVAGLVALTASCDGQSPDSSAQTTAPVTSAPSSSVPTAPCAGSPRPIRSVGHAFRARWSDTIDGSVASTDLTPSAIYVACEDGPSKSITAVSTTDGTTLWVTTLTPNGDWNGEFAVAATSAGALSSFQDDAGAHLVLLDAASGTVRWTRPIDEPAYDLLGEVTSCLLYTSDAADE